DIFSTNQNFVTNHFELWASLEDLACNNEEAREQRLSGIDASETCIKNNQKSDYAKRCNKDGDDAGYEKHGIEFRVYATRVGFERLEEEYWVNFAVN
uniref:Uncharacterized protein n=1 Tax=Meloidogyne floridensis TaxID=298350 RepID=A0A915ND19_9BILA